MNALHYKIKQPLDIEALSDELAGYYSAVRITESATIEIVFDDVVPIQTRKHIDSIMTRLGAEPIAT